MPSKTVVQAAVIGVSLVGAALVGTWMFWPKPGPLADEPRALVAVVLPASFEGRWRCVREEDHDKSSESYWRRLAFCRQIVTFKGDTISAPELFDLDGSFSLPVFPENAIDIVLKRPKSESLNIRGIYAVEGDRLKLCLSLSYVEKPRPIGFEAEPGGEYTSLTFERVIPGVIYPETAAEQLGAILVEAGRQTLVAAQIDALVARCLKIAESHPGTGQATVCLLWVLANAPESPAGKTALARLKGGGIAAADLEALAICFGVQRGTIGPRYIPDEIQQQLAPILLDRVRRTPDHPKAAEVLCAVCCAPDHSPEVPPAFDAAARMIGERWTKSPDLTHFLESLTYHRQRPWAGRYEPIVRSIRDQTPDNYIRYRAALTLAQLLGEAGEARQEEARDLYVRFVKDYKPGSVDQGVAGLVEQMVEQAKREIDALLIRGMGGPAPELNGLDLDGKLMALTEYRGKVVLLSFWGTWCGPCMRLIPHERALVEQFNGRPFAIVGVNGDEIEDLDRKLLEKHMITWRSFQNKRKDQKSISHEWNISGWPTLYLIDHTGKIRRRWIGTPPMNEFEHEVARWVAVAEGKPLPPVLRPVKAVEASGALQALPAKFVDKVHKDEQSRESTYAICVPDAYDGKTALPVVLFLHGSGQIGTDNREQLKIGLGPAIRKHGMAFPFIGVFPQSQGNAWLANDVDGKRALAILADVEREYATDPHRVYLTGVSMGGEGVWSLAATHPQRFAAIVPVCGGGDPKLAAKLKDLPCWAFHGDADEIVPVQDTRNMVKAITDAGGRPQYQEYRGAGHNCWDRVYADVEMYRWLQSQARQ